MIDEYQDTSPLFYGLIEAICRYHPHLRIVCVGDDWQLINGFAGSENQYFSGFGKEYFL